MQYQGVNYAGLRAAASFNGTNTTLIRDFLWDSTRDGICKGGYRTDVWQAVAGLMAANSLTVRLNSKWHCKGVCCCQSIDSCAEQGSVAAPKVLQTRISSVAITKWHQKWHF